jgi:hypothetical protein
MVEMVAIQYLVVAALPEQMVRAPLAAQLEPIVVVAVPVLVEIPLHMLPLVVALVDIVKN